MDIKKEYKIVSRLNSKCIQQKNDQLEIFTENGCANQTFFLEKYVDNIHYLIRSKISAGKVLDVCGESNKNGAKIIVYKQHNNANQLWNIVPVKENDKET